MIVSDLHLICFMHFKLSGGLAIKCFIPTCCEFMLESFKTWNMDDFIPKWLNLNWEKLQAIVLEFRIRKGRWFHCGVMDSVLL